MHPQPLALAAGAVAVVGAVLLGVFGMRVAHAPVDFRMAARHVRGSVSASALAGEYVSAVGFLGVAGLVLTDGLGMLWYSVGFTAGYLMLLVVVAGPLRRFGAFTVPDFALARLESHAARHVASVAALAVAWFLLLPQLDAAGVVLRAILGTPLWIGVLVLGGAVTAAVATGAARGITVVQAAQYWVMLMAVAVPALALLNVGGGFHPGDITSPAPPTFSQATTVEVPARVTLGVETPVVVTVDGHVDGVARDGTLLLTTGQHEVGGGTTLGFPAGSPAPHVAGVRALDGASWTSPFVRSFAPGAHPLTATYSLILATFLGAIGLPHLLLHSSTFRDGRAARRTTAFALVLLGIFFLFPTVFAVVGRLLAPGLYVTGQTDAAVVALPRMTFAGAGGVWLGALTTAGAFSALLCAGIGLLSGVAGTLSTALFGGGVRGFRRSAWLAGLVAALLALVTTGVPLAVLAGWAFAVAASTLCPLLVLGVWWRRLTWPGAVAGVACGGIAVVAAVVSHVLGVGDSGWPAVLLALPAVWTVPLAFAVMVFASLLSPGMLPSDVTGALLRMHLPEDLARPTGGVGVRRPAPRGTID